MTLKEAKQKIAERSQEYWDGYKGWSKEHPEMRADKYFEGKADGLEEALMILEAKHDA